MFKLVIQDDEGKTTIVPLIRDEITIGRKEGNTIRLTERNVSRRHARILRNNGEVHIEDLGSYNGIRVNNARIAERVSLRVSDQVQIGDYKLYLKAEGLDQVDESRTLPHDRVEPQMTDLMAVASSTNLQPPIQTAPPVSPSHTGNHTRPPIAIAEDAAGRPTTGLPVEPAGNNYGRIFVVSSNFAGKEFELSRPQMIIGRTEENDIVINHRSISRNHAKLVRDLESGRYTISDLQSSNGVRVNGQDYSKVELRRGDVIDLGHVRLRFVEAGEDFVFARDAVIMDVPEIGSRRGVAFAILAAIVVLGAGVAIYTTMHGGSDRADKPKDGSEILAPGPGTNGLVAPDAGDTAVAVEPPTVHPTIPTAEPAIDAARPAVAGSAAASAGKDDDKSQKAGKCIELQAAKDWQGLVDCAKALEGLGATDKAKAFSAVAVREQSNELKANSVRQALRERNLRDAQTTLAEIGEASVYYKSLSDALAKAEATAIEASLRKANGFAASHDCASLRTQYKQLSQSSSPRVAAAIAQVKCTERTAAADPGPVTRPTPAIGSASAASPALPPMTSPATAAGPCAAVNVDETMQQAANQYATGFAKSALTLVLKALACKQEIRMYRMAAMYACGAHDVTTARLYYKKLDPTIQSPIVQKCQQEGLDVRGP
jgi:pSer/pThr/pTyr-binding forkhead associated (FHA) protein